MNAMDLWVKGDGVSRGVASLLLAMSVGSWVVILWKAWMMHRVVGDVARSTAAFWQAGSVTDGHNAALLFDRHGLVDALISATQVRNPGTLSAAGDASQQLTRVLRDALHAGLLKLQSGQVLLATVGATAPFVGLLGTVWGIYHALVGLSAGTQISIDQISGPVGEALIMTAVGLAVAIPAVLGFNVLGRYISRVEAELEGFALDLRDLLLSTGASNK